jgi:D-alanyl-D-alanine dipeptidase
VLPLVAALLLAAPGELVDVARLVPDARLDLRYASTANFTGRALYPVARCLLRAEAAERLARAAAALRAKGYRLVLYDCYRPLSVQRQLWKARPERGFVADPATGSHHNRGMAVDVALADREGRPLEMPTDFDAFSPRARAWATEGLTPGARRHRDALRAAMLAAGFSVNPLEWWHYDAPRPLEAPLLDRPLDAPLPGEAR